MIKMFVDTKNGCLFSVKVKVEKKETRVAQVADSFVVIELKARPVENKANEELKSFLKNLLKSDVEIVSGHKSRLKKVFVYGLKSEECARIFLSALHN